MEILAAFVLAAIFAACPLPPDNSSNSGNEENPGHDIDQSLYGTWIDNRSADILTVTFSSGGIIWEGSKGNALNIQDAVWTAKRGTIKYTLSGDTINVFRYTINGSSILILSDEQDLALIKEGANSGGLDDYKPILLAENQWTDGNILSTIRRQWFTFTATASEQYIHVSFGTLTDLYVQVYDSNGSAEESETNLTGSVRDRYRDISRSLTPGQNYYIRVRPYNYDIDNNAAYRIAFNTSDIPPGVYGDFEYEHTAAAVTITGYIGAGGVVEIPSTIDEKPVTAIKDGTAINDGAFYKKELTGITIPDSVTYIGNYAFSGNKLTGITIPDGVTYIGNYALSDNQLTGVTIPDSVTAIGSGAFASNYLTGVTIPDSVVSIGDDAFNTNHLTGVTIPDSVTAIGSGTFAENRLTSVTIPDSVVYIGDHAFFNNRLTSVIIGANVTLGSNSPSFPGDLDSVYNSGGKEEGTYTRPDASSETWTKVNI